MVRTANPALLKPMNLTPELEAVVGKGPMPRGQVVKKMWEYIKKNDLQNPANKRNIFADEKLKPIFGGKKEVTMFEMTKLASGHINNSKDKIVLIEAPPRRTWRGFGFMV